MKSKYYICFMVLWILQMAAAFWFCTQKQGFHEDEFYTYYSTARTNGFYVEDGKWMERDAYRNEFVVLPEERFQYGLVKQVQSWDVHPPMYYWVFHTAASLVPGVFSKWIGLSVNLLFHGINLILLTYLSYLAAGRDKDLPFFVTFVYGFSPAAMSGVVFIRMYEMLTTFVLLCAVLHVSTVQRLQGSSGQCDTKISLRTLLAMAAVTYVGFLTQYYYFIFLFFLAAAFCVWLLWRDRGIGNCLRYGFFQVLAFVLAYLTYPAFPGQMFKGQRGAQATENFFDLSNTFERIGFFWDLMNRYVFGGLLGLIILLFGVVALAGCLMKASQRKRAHTQTSEKQGAGSVGSGRFSAACLFICCFLRQRAIFWRCPRLRFCWGILPTATRFRFMELRYCFYFWARPFYCGGSSENGPWQFFAWQSSRLVMCRRAWYFFTRRQRRGWLLPENRLRPKSLRYMYISRERSGVSGPWRMN